MEIRKELLSIIDKDLNIEGTVQFKGKIIVSGVLKGDLHGDHVLTSKGSNIHANVKVDEIIIGGTFEGNIIAYKRLKILKTGNVIGTLFCNTLIIEAGGIFNGRVKRLADKQAAPPLETKKVKPISSTVTQQ